MNDEETTTATVQWAGLVIEEELQTAIFQCAKCNKMNFTDIEGCEVDPETGNPFVVIPDDWRVDLTHFDEETLSGFLQVVCQNCSEVLLQ